MKTQLNVRLLLIPALLAVFMLSTMKCTHEDEVLDDLEQSNFEYGTDIINAAEGYAPDISHSSVRWESQYDGVGANQTGRFDEFTVDLNFDEDNPENTTISGTVTLSSVNTGSPGRDQGCLLGTLDVATSDEATFTATSVEKDGTGGYNVTADMTFLGVTDEIVGKLTYVGTTLFDETSGVRCAPLYLAGFIMEFDFNAKSVYGVQSGSIADLMHVRIDLQMVYIVDPDNC